MRGSGDASYLVSYKNNKKVGEGKATVKVLTDATGFKKGSRVTVGFKIVPKTVTEVLPYGNYDFSMAGEVFYKADATFKAGNKLPAIKLYQASADGKKLNALNAKDYKGSFVQSASDEMSYDLVIGNGSSGKLDFGSGFTIDGACRKYAKKAKKWTDQKALVLDEAAVIRNTGDNRSYSSEDIEDFAVDQCDYSKDSKGNYLAVYAGGCYILPVISELAVDGNDLSLEDGDYVISYAKNNLVGTGSMTVTLSQKAAEDYGIGGSKTYSFKIVSQASEGLTL